MSGFLGGVQFLTRIPIHLREPVPHHRVLPWFPVVGALIGLVVGGVAVALGEVLPSTVAAAVAVVVGLLVTGAFHEDGLADVADAFGGGWTPEQRLEILNDSRHGTYGVAALSSSILLRVVALASIAPGAALLAVAVAAHTLGRGAAVVAVKSARPARTSGLGVTSSEALGWPLATASAALAVAVSAAAAGWWAGPFAAAAVVGAVAVVVLSVRKIGGLVGDALGAVEQVVECLVMVVGAGLAARSAVWWA